jgi:hypothetical protein
MPLVDPFAEGVQIELYMLWTDATHHFLRSSVLSTKSNSPSLMQKCHFGQGPSVSGSIWGKRDHENIPCFRHRA